MCVWCAAIPLLFAFIRFLLLFSFDRTRLISAFFFSCVCVCAYVHYAGCWMQGTKRVQVYDAACGGNGTTRRWDFFFFYQIWLVSEYVFSSIIIAPWKKEWLTFCVKFIMAMHSMRWMTAVTMQKTNGFVESFVIYGKLVPVDFHTILSLIEWVALNGKKISISLQWLLTKWMLDGRSSGWHSSGEWDFSRGSCESLLSISSETKKKKKKKNHEKRILANVSSKCDSFNPNHLQENGPSSSSINHSRNKYTSNCESVSFTVVSSRT